MHKPLLLIVAGLLALFVGTALITGAVYTSAVASTDPVVAAAGDICWTDTSSCPATADLLDSINPDGVLTLGDNQYNDGTLAEYNSYYKPSWGRHDFHVYPAPGNHDFHTTGAQGYLDYFGARVPGYTYSYDLGAWHLVSLSGDVVSGNAPSVSAQNTWLQNDLASHQGQCILAYWHEPRFSSGTTHGSDSSVGPLWTTLYNAHAAIVLNGHEHNYERFAPQNPSGVADTNGIREFVVGTGGTLGGYTFGTPIANSEARDYQTKGVLKLTLHPSGYDWQFVPAAGYSFTDSGSGTCPGVSQPPTSTSSSSTTTSTTTPPPTTTTTPSGTPLANRYVYNFGTTSDLATQAADGWNLLDVGSKSAADALPAGSRALIWVGDYDNTTCAWEQSDSTVSSLAAATVGDAKVYGFFISDEPNPYACSNAPAQHKARADLIHAANPDAQVGVVLDSNGFSGDRTQDALDQLPLWTGKADFFGLDPYPCHTGQACDYTWIDRTIAAANSAGLNYWGVVQAFQADSWRMPTPAEEQAMFDHWCASAWAGYMTFAWNYLGVPIPSDVLAVLQAFNTNGCGTAPPPTTSSTTTSTTTPSTTTTPPTTTPTTTAADTTPPSIPTNLRITVGTRTSFTLAWNASTDNVGVTGYRVWRDGTLRTTTAGLTYSASNLSCSSNKNSYLVEVAAIDAAGNVSSQASYTAACSYH